MVWTIAGFDPSSGAGITADLKTISSLQCYGVACITALTLQNTLGVRRVQAVSTQTVRQTLQVLLEDLPPNAIKIGMLATAGVARAVANFLERLPQPRCPVVLDPILCSSSGAELLNPAGVRVLLRRLLPLATLVTPNRSEAAILTGLPASDAEAMAQALRHLGAAAAVVTGGDHAEENAADGNFPRKPWPPTSWPTPSREWSSSKVSRVRAFNPAPPTEPAAPSPRRLPAPSPSERICPPRSPRPRLLSDGPSCAPLASAMAKVPWRWIAPASAERTLRQPPLRVVLLKHILLVLTSTKITIFLRCLTFRPPASYN